MTDYYICPGCGTELKVGSKGCPKCNELDPWDLEDNALYDGLDLPDDEFNYDDFVKQELGKRSERNNGWSLFWWIVAIVLLVLWILGSLGF